MTIFTHCRLAVVSYTAHVFHELRETIFFSVNARLMLLCIGNSVSCLVDAVGPYKKICPG